MTSLDNRYVASGKALTKWMLLKTLSLLDLRGRDEYNGNHCCMWATGTGEEQAEVEVEFWE